MSITFSDSIFDQYLRRGDSFHILPYLVFLKWRRVFSRSYTSNFAELFNSKFSRSRHDFCERSRPAVKFRGEIYGVTTAVARSWNFLNDALLELVVRERAKGRNLTRPEVMLYYVSLALAVSSPHDNRFHSANVAGMRITLHLFPVTSHNFSRSVLRATDFTEHCKTANHCGGEEYGRIKIGLKIQAFIDPYFKPNIIFKEEHFVIYIFHQNYLLVIFFALKEYLYCERVSSYLSLISCRNFSYYSTN